MNRSRAVRTDLPYLSRRVKPRAAAAPVAAAPAASTPVSPSAPVSSGTPASPPRTTSAPAAPAPGSLSLSPPRQQAAPPTVSTSLSLGLSPNAEAHSNRATANDAGSRSSGSRGSESRGSGAPSSSAPSSPAAPAASPSAPAPLHTRLFPAPGIKELRTLDTGNPVLRLTPMESAVGSLAVAGTIRAVWEGRDFSTGSQPAPGPGIPADALEGVAVDTPGNRRLVSYEDDLALIALRHSGMLRRALFFPKPKQPMNVGLFNGESVTIPEAAGERSFYVLSVLRIGNVLELRAEVMPYGMELKSIWEAFGFSMTARFPFRGN
ncbi:hypothetical protein LJ753_11695 [Arthrobacter sp. zg-Y20]|uniref:hypothetical protein n=1 Tax=unclassified Arthrobacter TaxID=235627 RepID=UPI001D1487EF|nr:MULTISPECIES: hypothetical protein [unclassified Arthrobacter]MCC3276531.1 hypothetical protein [Arthrobacter sp. zg-Y20]MDK1316691.1 hypothetical protein [Arthrobacter sp. zg.Y20]WIB06886.1 hypothetical protein QNO06_03905 [Arthrobacter sp. zg-Y20]